MSHFEPNDPFDEPARVAPVSVPSPPGQEPERGEETTPSRPRDAGGPGEHPAGPVAWKAAASSVPRLRQKPAASTDLGSGARCPGFAQDALPAGSASTSAERAARAGPGAPDDDALSASTPLAVDPPLWEIWLERVRSLPRPFVLGAVGVLVIGVAALFFLLPRDGAPVSLARIRQHPEAYDGRSVSVHGKAGETFSIGGSYVYTLCQGRDTIVVYSRTRRPRLRQDIQATGTVSIGYLDGVPRVALLEDPPTP